MNIRKTIIVGLVLCIGTVFFGSSQNLYVYAATTLEQLQQAQQDKDKTESELDSKEDEIDHLEGQQGALTGQLNEFNQELTVITGNLNDLEAQIKDKEEEIAVTQVELKIAKENEAYQYACMKKRIQFMYENGETAYLEMMFSVDGLGELLNKADYIEQLSAYEQEQLELFQETKRMIEEQEALLIGQKAELDQLHEEEVAEQAKFNNLVSTTQSNLNVTEAELKKQEEAALALEAKIKEQENTIAALRKQYEAELALSNLAANSSWRDISEVTFAEGDRFLMASIIYCEAGGEPYAGQLAVGAVIINRLLSSKYPDNLTGVIYQKSQFSPVGSGRLALAMAQNKATPSCYKAADEAMKGLTNVSTCLYFRTPIEGVIPKYQIGGHIFY